MRNIEYKILKLLNRNALNISEIKSRLKSHNPFDIENTIEGLEENQLVEELFTKELAVYKTENIENLQGNMGSPTGYYLCTKDGIKMMEEEKGERFRFYMPFIFSALISLVSITVSVISLFISLST